jgi:hypothetical protein
MTSFIATEYPREHPGVVRAEAVVNAVADIGKNFDSAKTLATLLSAAVVAALVVVADRLIDTWADGHLLATWVIMWAVAFAALGFFAPMAKQGVRGLLEAYDDWAERSKNAHAEEAFWQSALNDPRVMAEYQAAKLRSEQVEMDRETSRAAQAPQAAAMVDAAQLGATLERVTADLSPSKRYLRYV